jgi:hypothetical protein
MAPPDVARRIRPQYSAPIIRIYEDAILHYMVAMRRAELLTLCNADFSQLPGLPSWVPDLSQPPPHTVDSTAAYTASAYSAVDMNNPEAGILELTGVCCGVVCSIDLPFCEKIVARVRRALQLPRDDPTTTTSYQPGGSWINAFISTICRNLCKDRFPKKYFPTLKDWEQAYLALTEQPSDGDHTPSILDTRTRRVLDRLKGWSLITTESGYIGLGPLNVQIGEW